VELLSPFCLTPGERESRPPWLLVLLYLSWLVLIAAEPTIFLILLLGDVTRDGFPDFKSAALGAGPPETSDAMPSSQEV